MRCGLAISASGHTGHCEAIHWPEAWANMVVKFRIREAGSTAVV